MLADIEPCQIKSQNMRLMKLECSINHLFSLDKGGAYY